MVAPIGVDHTDLGDRGVPMLAFEIALAEGDVALVHGQAVALQTVRNLHLGFPLSRHVIPFIVATIPPFLQKENRQNPHPVQTLDKNGSLLKSSLAFEVSLLRFNNRFLLYLKPQKMIENILKCTEGTGEKYISLNHGSIKR